MRTHLGLIRRRVTRVLAMFGALAILTISQATVIDSRCLAHPLSAVCENPPRLPDETPSEPSQPMMFNLGTAVTANTNVSFTAM